MALELGWFGKQRWEEGQLDLRPLAYQDIEAIRRWRNAQTRVLRQLEPISRDAQEDWFRDVVEPTHRGASPSFLLVAIEQAGAGLVGYGGLTNIDWISRRAEVSFLAETDIAADVTPYALLLSSFLTFLDRLAFEDVGLHRLFTETYAHRTAHLALLEARGYVLEGRLRDHVLKNETFVDSLIHGRLATDR